MNDSIFCNSEKQKAFLKQFSFVLKTPAILGYLSFYAAPFTGSGEIKVPVGTSFTPYSLMRDDAIFVDLIGEIPKLDKKIEKQESKKYPKLSDRFNGYSFFLTSEQLKELSLEFISGEKNALISFLDEYRQRYPDPWHRPGYKPRKEVTEDGRIITIL